MDRRGRYRFAQSSGPRPGDRGGRVRRPGGYGIRSGGDLRTARDLDFDQSKIVDQMESMSLASKERIRRPKLESELQEAMNVVDDQRVVDFGSSGSTVRVSTNFFKVSSVPNYKIWNYAVVFEPLCDSNMVKSKVLKMISRANWNNEVFSFTGQSIHLAHKLETLEYENVVFRQMAYKVAFQSTGETVPGTEPFVSILGRVLRGRLNDIGFRMIQRNMFDVSAEARRDVEGYQIFPGIKASILPRVEGRLMLCIDRINKIVNQNMASTIMSRYDLNSQYGQKNVIDEIVGSSVMTSYNNRFYRVTDVDFTCDATSIFSTDNDRRISFVDYYRERYHLDIRCIRLPLLVSKVKNHDGNKKEIRLIPEFCQVAGLDRVHPAEKAKMMRIVCKETIPQFRMKYINTVLHRLTNVNHSKHFPLAINKEPECIDGRYLPEPHPGDLSGRYRFEWRDIGRKPLFRPVLLDRWLVLVPEGCRADNFISSLRSAMRSLEMDPAEPRVRFYPVRGQNDVAAAQRVLDDNDVGMAEVVIVLMSNHCSARFYAVLKESLSVGHGVPSQFVKEKNFREYKMTVISKIAIQVGCKVGSEPWSISGGFGACFKDTMVVGIDCYHSKTTSFSAVVCSLNTTFSKCYSRCFMQSQGQELVACLTMCIKEAIERYKHHNQGGIPRSIIVYRDGIGDGQLGCIGMSECHQILAAMKISAQSSSANDLTPKLTYIVVKKRLNSRFFVRGKDSLNNPNGGLVVDRVVTMERWRDFYLIPQRVTQGSATPSHYNILTDKNGFGMDELQQLSYRLCHMYFNWPGAIRVPAMCQYAHKLAFLAGSCFRREPLAKLNELLYYL
ncbi:hypothetical protein ACOME3_008365 [Neoechinorhynchus agilis]